MMIQSELNLLLYKETWAALAPAYAATNNDAAVMFRAIATLTQGASQLDSTTLDRQIEHLSTHFPTHLVPLFQQLAKTYLLLVFRTSQPPH
jgi:hypothetical protein